MDVSLRHLPMDVSLLAIPMEVSLQATPLPMFCSLSKIRLMFCPTDKIIPMFCYCILEICATTENNFASFKGSMAKYYFKSVLVD